MDRMIQGFNPGRGQKFLTSPKCPDEHWTLHYLVVRKYQGYFQGVQQLGCDVKRSPPSRTYKNEWSYTSLPPISLHGLHRDNFTFYA